MGSSNFDDVDVSGSLRVRGVDIPGAIASSSGISYLPEKWAQNNVQANQAAVVLPTLVSINFDDVKMVRAGSLVGLGTRLTENITNGTLTVRARVNGVAVTLQLVHTSGANAGGGQVTQAAGVDNYVAGDLVGLQITTDAGFLPTTTDIEALLQVRDS